MTRQDSEELFRRTKEILVTRFGAARVETEQSDETELKKILEFAVRKFLLNSTILGKARIDAMFPEDLHMTLAHVGVGSYIPEILSTTARENTKADADTLVWCAAAFAFIEKPTFGSRIAAFADRLKQIRK